MCAGVYTGGKKRLAVDQIIPVTGAIQSSETFVANTRAALVVAVS